MTSNRVAIVGGEGGIGAAVAARLAEVGYEQVFSLDREQGDREQGDREQRASEFVPCDLLSEDSIAAAAEQVFAAGGGPVDLVNSAGIVEDDVAAEEMPTELLDRVLGVNFRGAFLTCKYFGRQLLEHGSGAIVNIASMSGNLIVNHPQKQSIYNSSKAALTALTKSLAVEWTPRGVRVNAISPGYINTPLNALKEHMHEGWNAGTVAGRMGTPLEVADAVEYLLSDRSGYCVGTELVLDGGFSLR